MNQFFIIFLSKLILVTFNCKYQIKHMEVEEITNNLSDLSVSDAQPIDNLYNIYDDLYDDPYDDPYDGPYDNEGAIVPDLTEEICNKFDDMGIDNTHTSYTNVDYLDLASTTLNDQIHIIKNSMDFSQHSIDIMMQDPNWYVLQYHFLL